MSVESFKCNIHLVSWLEGERGTSCTRFDGNLNNTLSTKDMKVMFTYPLSIEVTADLPAPITYEQFITFVAQTYEGLYSTEKDTSTIQEGQAAPWLLNRNKTDGKYGIWGHDIGDLYLEGAQLSSNGTWDLRMGS